MKGRGAARTGAAVAITHGLCHRTLLSAVPRLGFPIKVK